MIVCPDCKINSPDDSAFCIECRKPLKKLVKCPKCGSEMPADRKTCARCGASLESDGMHGSSTTDNIFGGNVSDSFNTTNTTTYIVSNESNEVLTCHICGLITSKGSGIMHNCPECKKIVCADHFDKKYNMCVKCDEVHNQEESRRKAEEARKAEEKRRAEEARRAAEKLHIAEMTRKAEEARLRAENERIAREKQRDEAAKRRAEEERKAAEERKRQEQARIEEYEKRRAEERRRLAEEERIKKAKKHKKMAFVFILLFIAAIIAIILFPHITKCKHENTVTLAGYPSTCSKEGLSDGKKCIDCGEIIEAQTVIPIKPHSFDGSDDDVCNVCGYTRDLNCSHKNVSVIKGYAPTCSKEGLSDGTRCEDCQTVITEQVSIPTANHTYDGILDSSCNVCGFTRVVNCPHKNTEVIKGYDSTCFKEGLSDGTICEDCQTVITEQISIPTANHTYDGILDSSCNICGFTRVVNCPHKNTEVIKGYDSTCSKEGLSDGIKCADCEKTVSGQTIIAKKSHTEITDSRVEPTCTQTGLTEGKHCSSCQTIIVQQQTLPTQEHNFINTICAVCGKKDESYKKLIFILNSDKNSYSVSGIGAYTNDKLYIPNEFNGLPVTGISANAFKKIKTITSVFIPDSIITIGQEAFYECTYIESVTIGNNVLSIGQKAFANCERLTELTIPSSVKIIDSYAFENCKKMSSLIFEDQADQADTSKLSAIGSYAFQNCALLETLSFGNGVESIGNHAFYNCKNLTSVIISNNVKSIGANAFFGCSKLADLTIHGNVETIGTKAFTLCNIKNLTLGIEKIPPKIFYNFDSLEKVTLFPGVKFIGNEAFGHCNELETFVMSDTVISIGDLNFSNCHNLKNLTVSNNLKSIGRMVFNGCTNVTEIALPSTLEYIGEYTMGSIETIMYNGTISQWEAIQKEANWNYSLYKTRTIYCTDGTLK